MTDAEIARPLELELQKLFGLYDELGLPPEVMNTCGIFGKAGAMGEFNIYEGWERRIVRAGDLSYIRD